jgi:Rod binding domain-containing protein
MSAIPAFVAAPGGTSAPSAATPTPPQDRGELRKSAEDFEAVFLSTVISRMFASIPVDGPFGGGHAEATYRSFLADEYAAELSRQGGIGIADAVYADLVRLQETSAP